MPPAPQRLVLASASPRRLDLLRQVGLAPDQTCAPAVDESPHPEETPRRLALRLAKAKVSAVHAEHGDAYVIAADTVVALGRRILPKAEDDAQVEACLGLLSGRAHRVLTAVAVAAPERNIAVRLAETRLRFRRLGPADVLSYLGSGEGIGKAGGYAIQGRAGAFVISLQGSYPAVVGLPLYETVNLLAGMGYRLP